MICNFFNRRKTWLITKRLSCFRLVIRSEEKHEIFDGTKASLSSDTSNEVLIKR
ncbi:MAG: hypothetical protein ACTS80_00410 [Candidatus Hodgkinia cicadicola]